MMKISILGCGWLGLPLAKLLIDKGFDVKGSTTSATKMADLENAGIDAFQVTLYPEHIDGNIVAFLEDSEVLIVDIPPKLRGNQNENFTQKIKTLMPFIEKAGVKHVIFVSSISVFSDDHGIVSDTTLPNPDSESGKQLFESEMNLMQNPNFSTTVVRFGGLIGASRHPVKYLSGKVDVENPDSPINLIHQSDCIGIIEKIIENKAWNEIFNAVAPFHPTRKEYYTKMALQLNLPVPEFASDAKSAGKTIDSAKIKTFLNYGFKMPEL